MRRNLAGKTSVPISSPRHNQRIKVLLVDDHVAVRHELQKLLALHNDVEVIGEAGDGKDALALVERQQPHVILLDLNMPRMNGIEVAGLIRKSWPNIAIIGLCAIQDAYTMEAFLKAGALAVITKDDVNEQLYSMIQRAYPATRLMGTATQ